MSSCLKDQLESGRTALGLGLMYPNPNCIEAMASGWDWIWIDGQHGQMDYATILHAVQMTRAAGVAAITRVPGHSFDIIGPVLDTGTDGLMVPMVNTADQARAIVESVYFPPLGSRSYGGRRVIDIGGRDYYQDANARLTLVAQIETLEAVENAADIAAVDGVDCLFFGPDDMKMRMDLPINTPIDESPELQTAMKQVAEAARESGKVAGCVAGTSAAMTTAVSLGYRLVVGGADIGFLRVAAAAKAAELRAAIGQVEETPGTPDKDDSAY